MSTLIFSVTHQLNRQRSADIPWGETMSPPVRRQRAAHAAPPPGPDRVTLVAALRELPERPRHALVLYYLGDQSVAEIARSMGTAEGTVKVWLHRGRAALAARLGTPESTVDGGVGRARPHRG
jgi:DNA-directed RNA polymerase specialized sigma24 family protein